VLLTIYRRRRECQDRKGLDLLRRKYQNHKGFDLQSVTMYMTVNVVPSGLAPQACDLTAGHIPDRVVDKTCRNTQIL
jgi:hypothetical protein